MRIRHHLHIARNGSLYRFGGDSEAQANTSTATNTRTSQVNTDQSMMGGDGAVGINGTSNLVDKSVVNNTAFTDTSNRSTNFSDTSDRSTNFTDTSNRSVNSSKAFSDSSNRAVSTSSSNSTVTNNTATDFGAVVKALDGMNSLSNASVNMSGQMVRDGFGAVSSQSRDNINVLDKAFNFVAGASATNARSYTDMLGFATDTIAKTGTAYADAKDGGTNKTLLIAAVATVAAVGLAVALRN